MTTTASRNLPIPDVSFHDLPNMFIVVGRGKVGKVKICSPEVFRLRVQQAIDTLPARRQAALKKSLLEDPVITYAAKDKDKDGMHDRYFAVTELHAAHCEPFVFSFYIDDREARPGARPSKDNKLL